MNAERVVEKILSEARAKAEKINSQVRQELAGEDERFERELAEYRRQTDELAQKAAGDRKLRLLANARMELAKKYLSTKRELLDEVWAAAAEQLKNLDDDQYHGLMSKLMLKAVQTGDEEVFVG